MTEVNQDVADAAEDVVDHVTEARQRARQMLGAEAHVGAVDDWRQSLVSARDALILMWVVWALLCGFGEPPFTAPLLAILAVVHALLVGITTGRSAHAQVQYYAAELERERGEIRDHFDHECEEIRALYAAKGFQEPLLGRIVDTLSADDDRLLKVMMEEELGLQMYHMNHPLLVGLWNAGAAMVMGLGLIAPTLWLSSDGRRYWMPTVGVFLLMLVAFISARATRRNAVEFFAAGLITAVVAGGVAFYLSQWWVSIS